MKLVKYYLKENMKWMFATVLCLLVMVMIIGLNGVPIGDWGYAALLCLFMLLVIGGIDFTLYDRRHKKLQKVQNVIRITVDAVEAPKSQLEEDYQELLRLVHEDKIKTVNELERKKTDMSEYYNMWVHQIKTPIAAMRLMLQAMEKEEYNPLVEEEYTEHRNYQELQEELFSIQQYVDMALQYCRLDTDANDFIIKRHNLDDIVRAAVHKYASIFIRKKITLNFEPLHTEVLTDGKWLQFVVEQLLSNAIKYTPAGSISIYMRENETLVIEDTGIGIRSEDLPRVCEKGYTGYNGHSDKRSTGIGLYLCQRILHKLTHTIRIESALGEGTKVCVGLHVDELQVE